MQTGKTASARGDLALLLGLAAARLLLHVLVNGEYGFHRDELVVLDDARHLDWGYVAYPPLTPAIGRVALELFGESLTGFRFFAALAQCVAMLLAGLIARELGGGRIAQIVAAVATAAAPFSLLAGGMLQYVAFDYLWWVLLAWLALRLLNREDPRLWLAIGLVIGLGMLTRYTMLFCVAGLAVGVVATPLRRQLASPWPWAGAALSLLVFAPNALWQWRHDFVYLDFVQHIHARDVRIGRTEGFFTQQLYVNASALTLPLWVAGLWFVAFARDGARHRLLAWLFGVPLALFWLAQGRAYYLAPAYPMLLAAGAVTGERWLARLRPRAAAWTQGATWTLLALACLGAAAIALPLAPVNSPGWRLSRAAHRHSGGQLRRSRRDQPLRSALRPPAGDQRRQLVLVPRLRRSAAADADRTRRRSRGYPQCAGALHAGRPRRQPPRRGQRGNAPQPRDLRLPRPARVVARAVAAAARLRLTGSRTHTAETRATTRRRTPDSRVFQVHLTARLQSCTRVHDRIAGASVERSGGSMTHTTLKLMALAIGLGFAAAAMAQGTTPQTDASQTPAVDSTQSQPMQSQQQSATPQSPATTQQPPDQQIEGALTQAGYSNVANLEEQSTGIWAAEARNPQGQQVSLQIDVKTGNVQETPAETEEAE